MAGPLVTRIAGAELGRDDHGQAGLAQARARRTAARGPAAGRGAARWSAPGRSCSRTFGWPTKSASRRGRSAASSSRSSRSAYGLARSVSSTLTHLPVGAGVRRCERCHRGLSTRSAARSSAGTSGSPSAVRGDRGDRLVGLPRRPAEPDQRLADLVPPGRGRRDARPARAGVDRADLVPQLQHQPLGALLADAGHPGQRGDVRGRDRAADLGRRQHDEHGLGQPRADAAGGLQQLEHRRARRRRRSRTG